MGPSTTDDISQLREIDEYEFEKFIADLWECDGWTSTVTKGSNDQGIDVIVEKNDLFPQKGLIQVKRYAEGNKIGPSAIQQYSSLRHQKEDADFVVVVTTSSFTSGARRTANELNVKLVDSSALRNMISNVESDSLLEKYIDFDEEKSPAIENKTVEDYREDSKEKIQKEDQSESTIGPPNHESRTQSAQSRTGRDSRSSSSGMYKTPSGYVHSKEEQKKEYRDAAIIVFLTTSVILYFMGLQHFIVYYFVGSIVLLLLFEFVSRKAD